MTRLRRGATGSLLALMAGWVTGSLAQDPPRRDLVRYAVLGIGVSGPASSRTPAGLLGFYRGRGRHVTPGIELELHSMAPKPLTVVSPPCLPPGACTLAPTAGRDLLVGGLRVEAFPRLMQSGWFVGAGAGPGVYLDYQQPASTPRWSLVAHAGGGYALPVYPVRLRLELRAMQVVHPDYRPLQMLMIAGSLQISAVARESTLRRL